MTNTTQEKADLLYKKIKSDEEFLPEGQVIPLSVANYYLKRKFGSKVSKGEASAAYHKALTMYYDKADKDVKNKKQS